MRKLYRKNSQRTRKGNERGKGCQITMGIYQVQTNPFVRI